MSLKINMTQKYKQNKNIKHMESLQKYAQKNMTNHIKAYADSSYCKLTKLYIDKDKYLADNKGINREDMPQIDFFALQEILPTISNFTRVETGSINICDIKATQNDVNISKVMRKVADGKLVRPDYVFILGKDNFLLDGHHTHLQCCIQEPERVSDYIRFSDIDIVELVKMFTTVLSNATLASRDIEDNVIKECFESYGAQGPSAVPGMGAVELPNVATNPADAMNPDNRGSGDFPGTVKDKDKKEIELSTNKPAYRNDRN